MFNKSNGNVYIMDPVQCDRIVSTVRAIYDEDKPEDKISELILERSIKEMVCYKVAMSAIAELKDSIVKNGFVVIQTTGVINMEASVGYLNDEFVWGILIR